MLPLVTIPNPSLRQPSQPVSLPLTQDVKDFIKDMVVAMIEYDGVGLAAPQVGRNINIIVINTEEAPTVYINPVVKKTSWRKDKQEEGCLSVPGVFGVVRRPIIVTVEYNDLEGNLISEELNSFLARVFQHEVDHLNGILFTDKVLEITKGADLLEQYLKK